MQFLGSVVLHCSGSGSRRLFKFFGREAGLFCEAKQLYGPRSWSKHSLFLRLIINLLASMWVRKCSSRLSDHFSWVLSLKPLTYLVDLGQKGACCFGIPQLPQSDVTPVDRFILNVQRSGTMTQSTSEEKHFSWFL